MTAKIPKWQRAICGSISVAGAIALPTIAWSLPKGEPLLSGSFIMFAATSWGFFLFGFAAIKGRLPLYMLPPRHRNRHI